MKKVFLFLMFCWAMICPIYLGAQTETRWGVSAGANYNNLHFKQSDLMSVSQGFGPIGGLKGELNIAGIGFGIETGLLYSMRSGKINYGEHLAWSSLGLGNETYRMHYIDVPLHLQFKYHKLNGVENTIMPIIFAGPTFSFLVGKNLEDVNKYTPVTVILNAGLGAELFRHWQLRVAYGFSVSETLRTRLLDENSAKNRGWNASVTYYFK